jgi:hypothetical protein
LAKIRLICVFTVAGERWCLADLAVGEAERDRVENVAFSGGQNREALSARDGLVAAGVGVDELPCDAGRHDGIASSDDAYGVHEFWCVAVLTRNALAPARSAPKAYSSKSNVVSTITRLRSPPSTIARVAWIPS